jgi:hypothetical protein
MNVRKHLAGLAIFSFILGSAILINHFLTIPNANIPPIAGTENLPGKVKDGQPPVTYRVRQVSLDYINRKSYTELSLFRQWDGPAPEKVWVTTTFFSPDSTRAQDWTTVTEIRQPFAAGNGEVFIATSLWELPPFLNKPGDGYFARVDVSLEREGKVYPPDYSYTRSDLADAVPVVIHWPDKQGVARSTAKKSSR